MRLNSNSRWMWAVSWVVLTLLLVMAMRVVAWREVMETALTASWPWLVLAVLLNGGILIFAAWQWMVLLPVPGSIGFKPMLWIMAVTSTVSNGGLFLTGHATGIYLLATRGEIGYPSATSVKVMDQFMEGISKLLLVGLTLALAPMPLAARGGGVGLLGLMTVFAVGLLLAAHHGHHLEFLTKRWSGLRGRLMIFFVNSARDLQAMRQPRAFFLALSFGLLQKVLEGLAIWAACMAVGFTFPIWGILLVLAAVNLSTMVSLTPGNLGVYEGSAVVAYQVLGLNATAALAIALLQHALYLIPMAGCGWGALLFTGTRLGVLKTTANTEGS